MCTFVIANDPRGDGRVVIGANRDEFHARPTAGPSLVRDGIIAGRDLKAGGTWLGASADGFFVGLTNQRSEETQSAPLSRGQIVMDALERRDADEVSAALHALDVTSVRPFNLLFGRSGDLRVAYARPDSLRVEPLPKGIFILPNDDIGSARFFKVKRALELTQEHDVFDAREMQSILADHQLPPRSFRPWSMRHIPEWWARRLDVMCVHGAVYGTRSASIVELQPGRTREYVYIDGPPCRSRARSVVGQFA